MCIRDRLKLDERYEAEKKLADKRKAKRDWMQTHRKGMSQEERETVKEKDRKRKAKLRMKQRKEAGTEVKERKSKYDSKKYDTDKHDSNKKVSKKQQYA